MIECDILISSFYTQFTKENGWQDLVISPIIIRRVFDKVGDVGSDGYK